MSALRLKSFYGDEDLSDDFLKNLVQIYNESKDENVPVMHPDVIHQKTEDEKLNGGMRSVIDMYKNLPETHVLKTRCPYGLDDVLKENKKNTPSRENVWQTELVPWEENQC